MTDHKNGFQYLTHNFFVLIILTCYGIPTVIAIIFIGNTLKLVFYLAVEKPQPIRK